MSKLVSISSSAERSGMLVQPDRTPAQGLQQAKVLIVDDEWFISMEMKDTLEDAGYEVVGAAASADEALRMVDLYRPNLVLMDVRLRGKRDGVEAAIEINRRFSVRCIFVSAHVDAHTRERGQAADPFGWLPKPFSSPQLVIAVHNALQNLR
jgi:DNA-binding NarL/FixJ family response regulator